MGGLGRIRTILQHSKKAKKHVHNTTHRRWFLHRPGQSEGGMLRQGKLTTRHAIGGGLMRRRWFFLLGFSEVAAIGWC
jgi:hypothetical protein